MVLFGVVMQNRGGCSLLQLNAMHVDPTVCEHSRAKKKTKKNTRRCTINENPAPHGFQTTSSRLNSGPVGEFSGDVGKRTTLRMSYPEGTPLQWDDQDRNTVFVALAYKGVDISWISAMINKQTVVSPGPKLSHFCF